VLSGRFPGYLPPMAFAPLSEGSRVRVATRSWCREIALQGVATAAWGAVGPEVGLSGAEARRPGLD